MHLTLRYLFVLLLSGAAVVGAQDSKRVTMLGGRVCFVAAREWEPLEEQNTSDREVRGFRVPTAAPEGCKDATELVVAGQLGCSAIDLRSYSDQILAPVLAIPGTIVVNDGSDGGFFRLVQMSSRDPSTDTAYMIVDRFYRRDDICVHFRTAIALPDHAESGRVEAVLKRTNDLHFSLSIDGKPAVSSATTGQRSDDQ